MRQHDTTQAVHTVGVRQPRSLHFGRSCGFGLPSRVGLLHAELVATTRPSGSALAAWPTHLVDGWRRGTIDIDVESATWHKVIMRVTDGAATRWVTIPGEDTDSFVGSLQHGELDAWLQAQLASTHIERVSRSRAAARRAKVQPDMVD